MSVRGKWIQAVAVLLVAALVTGIGLTLHKINEANEQIESLIETQKKTNERLTETELEVAAKQAVVDSLTAEIKKVKDQNTGIAKDLEASKEAAKKKDARLQQLEFYLNKARGEAEKAKAEAALANKRADARAAKKKAAQVAAAEQAKQAKKKAQVASTKKTPAASAAKKTVAVAQATPSRSSAPSGGKSFMVQSTAYTAYCAGCSGTTRTGINLRANPGLKVIAVDPSVIPLGSKVHVEGYGNAIAGDTGGAIKGHKIDVFVSDQQAALNWGRRSVKVTILQ